MRSLLLRALIAALLGAALVLAWWGFFRLFPNLPVHLVGDEKCRNDLGCGLGAAYLSIILTVTLVALVSVAVGMVVLRAIGFRPALPVAILGPVIGWLVLLVAGKALHLPSVGSLWWVVAGMAAGYGLAGLISPRRQALPPARWRSQAKEN